MSTRRIAIGGALALLLPALAPGLLGALSAAAADRPADRPGFTFAVVGDRTGHAVEGVFEGVLEEITFLGPDLVVTVGDHIEGYESDSASIEAQWDYVVGLLDGMGLRYHLTPGNHDIWDGQSRRIYRRRFGSPDTAFVFMGNLFVILDVSTEYRADALGEGKMLWLEGVLGDWRARAPDADILVFYHKPLWCEDFASARPNRLHEIFLRYGVDAVFTGHYHRYFYDERDGIRYFGVSSSGGSLPPGGRVKGCYYAYLLARAGTEHLDVRLIEPGFLHAPDAVTVREATEIARIEKQALVSSEIVIDGFAGTGTEKVTVTIHNPGTQTLRDTAIWRVPAGWVVVPSRDYVEVPPGETGTLAAFAAYDGALFPVPSLSLEVPYDEERAVAVTEPLQVRRLARAPRAGDRPVVDGFLNEPLWDGEGAVMEFYGRPGASPGDSTILRLRHDGANLYVGVVCMERDPDAITAVVEARDGFGGYDDYVSLLVEPDPGSEVFYQISTNPAGTLFDRMIEICPFGTYVIDMRWDPPVEVATKITADGWLAELAVPLSALGGEVEAGARWGFNFRRMHRQDEVTSDFQIPLWYDTDRLGLLEFE